MRQKSQTCAIGVDGKQFASDILRPVAHSIAMVLEWAYISPPTMSGYRSLPATQGKRFAQELLEPL